VSDLSKIIYFHVGHSWQLTTERNIPKGLEVGQIVEIYKLKKIDDLESITVTVIFGNGKMMDIHFLLFIGLFTPIALVCQSCGVICTSLDRKIANSFVNESGECKHCAIFTNSSMLKIKDDNANKNSTFDCSAWSLLIILAVLLITTAMFLVASSIGKT